MKCIFGKSRTHELKLWLRAVAGVLVLGCGGDGPTEPPPPPASVATTIAPVSATSLNGDAGEPVTEKPSVIVRDQRGNPMAGVSVVFSVAAGGGSLTDSVPTTDATGTATVGNWTLGLVPGANSLRVTAGALPALTFSATGRDPLQPGMVVYAGSYPDPVDIEYTDGGVVRSVKAYPGQVAVRIDPSVNESDALTLIRSLGGKVASKVPLMGFYRATVAPGQENQLITPLRADQRVRAATPHTFSTFDAGAFVVDECPGHGDGVTTSLNKDGGSAVRCLHVGDDKGQVPVEKLAGAIATAVVDAPTGPVLLNMSFSGGGRRDASKNRLDYASQPASVQKQMRDEWTQALMDKLGLIAALPPAERERTVVTVAAGNYNIPISQLLDDIRTRPALAAVLKNNVMIVSTDSLKNPPANHGKRADGTLDPDVAIRNNADAKNGTSYAAPSAMAIIQNVARLTGESETLALKAAKQAVATNIGNKLTQSEAIDKARDLIAAKNDPPAALNVTKIVITGCCATTSATITPAAAGVTVSYTVSGSDGYFDSGRRTTNAGGSVSFTIPAGAKGVKDQISVVAVQSGFFDKREHIW